MRKITIFIFPTLIFTYFIFTNYVLGATEVTGGCCDTTIVFNSPQPNKTYNVGDKIDFSGKFRVTNCGNGLFFNKVTFYITEDKDIPITDCKGRNYDPCGDVVNEDCNLSPTYCYGTKSTEYSHCNFQWYHQVKYLDTTKGYKIYKLGEVYPPDVGSGAKPYWVEYNQSFTIPSNLGFSGPVRFYVQYSGTEEHRHWHWNITYQPGYINSPPSAKNLQAKVFPDETNCQTISFPAVQVSWQFTHPEGDSQSAYQVQIDNNPDFSSPEVDSGKINSSSNSYATLAGKLSWNTTYYWRLKVWDSNGLSSDWILGPSFNTPKHAYPSINFSWSPSKPTVKEVVQFVDQSEVYNAKKISWYWTFQDGNPSFSTQQNPTTTFSSTGPKKVTLKVTDSDGYSCTDSKTVQISLPLPQWKEISLPLIWLKKFLASLLETNLKF